MAKADRVSLEEFEDVMGNQLTILNGRYRRCVDKEFFPQEELRVMIDCIKKMSLALRSYTSKIKRAD